MILYGVVILWGSTMKVWAKTLLAGTQRQACLIITGALRGTPTANESMVGLYLGKHYEQTMESLPEINSGFRMEQHSKISVSRSLTKCWYRELSGRNTRKSSPKGTGSPIRAQALAYTQTRQISMSQYHWVSISVLSKKKYWRNWICVKMSPEGSLWKAFTEYRI